jgi:RND family efflux transporter MFP subunit
MQMPAAASSSGALGTPMIQKPFARSTVHLWLTSGRTPGDLLPALAALALMTTSCAGVPAGAGNVPQGPPPTPVALSTVHQAEIEDTTEYVGTLRSLHSTPIQPQVEGRIVRIDVKSGDRVKAGDPIVQIDAQRQAAAVSSQEATRAALEANVAYAKSELARANTLLEAGAISRQELEQAETALKTAEANLQAQQAQIQEGQVQLRYFTVTAPTDGLVGDVPARVGNQVTSSTVLTSIDEIATLEVHVQVPVERAADLKLGLPLRVLGADGSPAASTTVSFVSPRVDDATQTVLVKGIVRNPGSLRSSQFVRAQIVWKSTTGLLIPVLAVTRVNDQYFAFVAEQKDNALVASQRPIRVGGIVGNDYVLLGGIEPNDRLVVSGVQKLADGAPLMPMDQKPEGQR